MARPTKCLTPGTQFHTSISDRRVKIEAELPFDLKIDEAEAEILEDQLHNAMESILRYYFKE